ncbi:MAG: thioredoxin [Candidatus Altiarchaeota archaeon]
MDELEEIRKMRMNELMEKQMKKTVDKPVDVTDGTLDDLVSKNPLVVVDCWAPWCGPCNAIAPVIEELAKDYAGKIVFGKLNVDENRDTASKYGIRGIPLLLVFKGGRLVDQLVGAKPRQILEAEITKHLDKK